MAIEQEKADAYKEWAECPVNQAEKKEQLWRKWASLEGDQFARHCRISRANGLSEPQPLYFG